MPLDEQARSYLWDIHEAAREIEEFLSGEAAVHLSPQFRKKHPGINWARLVELRNVLAH